MPYFKAQDGTKLFYSDWGTGKSMVFVASQAMSSNLWASTIPFYLERDFAASPSTDAVMVGRMFPAAVTTSIRWLAI